MFKRLQILTISIFIYLQIVDAVVIKNKLLPLKNFKEIFFDTATNEASLPPVVTWLENLPSHIMGSEHSEHSEQRQRPFRNPCSCNGLNCGCCVGFNFPNFNFRRQMCTNFTYEPYEFAIQMDVLMNESSIYQNMISAKNPQPICVPVPYLPAAADMCIKLFNIFTPGRNIHMCLDWLVRIAKQPILVLHFDCMRMGQNGIAFMKPDQNGGLDLTVSTGPPNISAENNNSPAITESPQTDYDIYDDVTEIKIN